MNDFLIGNNNFRYFTEETAYNDSEFCNEKIKFG